jgi:hypothetical protein
VRQEKPSDVVLYKGTLGFIYLSLLLPLSNTLTVTHCLYRVTYPNQTQRHPATVMNSQNRISGGQSNNTTDMSQSNGRFQSSATAGIPKLNYPPAQRPTVNYPLVQLRKNLDSTSLTILDPAYTHVTGQSLGKQGYIPPTLVYPANPSPAGQTQANQPVLNSTSHPRGDASSYPKMGASVYTACDSTATSASSSVSPQVYQWPSPRRQTDQDNYSSPNATPADPCPPQHNFVRPMNGLKAPCDPMPTSPTTMEPNNTTPYITQDIIEGIEAIWDVLFHTQDMLMTFAERERYLRPRLK